jgi:anaerobic magnesium-protoporphyrin IX monomethyl ester cyclase
MGGQCDASPAFFQRKIANSPTSREQRTGIAVQLAETFMNVALVGAECEENLAVRYIRAALEAKGHLVRQIVFNAEAELERAATELAQSGAALAGFSMVFTYRASEFAALAKRARELGYAGHLVAGGHFAAFNAEALLRDAPAFDSIAIGEGEDLMCELADRWPALAAVRGLVWRDASGLIHGNRPAAKPPDLDRLAPPTRLEPPDAYLGLPVANLLSSRGCSRSCAFCSIAAWHRLCRGPTVRLRTPAAVADEMARLYERGYRIFNFHDDNFLLPDKRQNLRRFWRWGNELQARGLGRIAFAVKSRPDAVEEEVFAFLKELGLFRVFLGIEAGTSEALHRLDRRQTLEDNERALEIVNRLDLHACFNLLLLNPDSTLADFRANVAFLRAHARNPMNFCRTEIYAGTPLEARLRRAGRLLGDYWGYGYRIQDARAQEVFELIYGGLAERHCPENCVHHLTMRADFERQLLAHFWSCPESLRQRVKDFTRRVNLDSCQYLEEIADRAEKGFADRADRAAYVQNLSARVRLDNIRFSEEGSQLVAAIGRASQPQKRVAGMWRQDAAAVLVSSLTLVAGSSCNRSTDQDGLPSGPKAEEITQAQGKASPQAQKLRQALQDMVVLRALARDLDQALDVDLELWVNPDGRLARSVVLAVAPGPPLGSLDKETRKKATDLIQQAQTGSEVQRQQAAAALQTMGPNLLPLLRASLAGAKNSNAVPSLIGIIDSLEAPWRRPNTVNLRAALRNVQIADRSLCGKVWLLRYTAEEIKPHLLMHSTECAPLPPTHPSERPPLPPKKLN